MPFFFYPFSSCLLPAFLASLSIHYYHVHGIMLNTVLILLCPNIEYDIAYIGS